jgi:hypothetical protein
MREPISRLEATISFWGRVQRLEGEVLDILGQQQLSDRKLICS